MTVILEVLSFNLGTFKAAAVSLQSDFPDESRTSWRLTASERLTNAVLRGSLKCLRVSDGVCFVFQMRTLQKKARRFCTRACTSLPSASTCRRCESHLLSDVCGSSPAHIQP